MSLGNSSTRPECPVPTIRSQSLVSLARIDSVPFTFRLKLPANSKIAPHTHPAHERVTVLSGAFSFAAGDTYDPAKARPLAPGSVAIMPAGTPMFARPTIRGKNSNYRA